MNDIDDTPTARYTLKPVEEQLNKIKNSQLAKLQWISKKNFLKLTNPLNK